MSITAIKFDNRRCRKCINITVQLCFDKHGLQIVSECHICRSKRLFAAQSPSVHVSTAIIGGSSSVCNMHTTTVAKTLICSTQKRETHNVRNGSTRDHRFCSMVISAKSLDDVTGRAHTDASTLIPGSRGLHSLHCLVKCPVHRPKPRFWWKECHCAWAAAHQPHLPLVLHSTETLNKALLHTVHF